MTSATNPRSERVASSHENSTSSTIERASRTASMVAAITSSRSIRSLYVMWMSLVAMKVWMRGRSASRTASAAAATSRSLARARAATVTPETSSATARVPSMSPGEEIGKPASMTSTPRRASCWPISTFSRVLRWIPGDCSPSRRVVSKILTRWAGSCCGSCRSSAVTEVSSSRMGLRGDRARRIRAWVSASSPYRGRSPRSARRSRDRSEMCATSEGMTGRIPAPGPTGKRPAALTSAAGWTRVRA